MLSRDTLAYGERIAAALLGVDALYRRESGDEEGLVVLNMAADELTPALYADYDIAAASFLALQRDAAELPEADRRCYYDQLCHSTLAFIRWRTRGIPFEEQLTDFLHVPAAPATTEELTELTESAGELLGRMGYAGNIREQCAAWEQSQRTSADQVPAVADALLSEAWDRTAAVMEIPAPKHDGMKVIPVSGQAFNARCNYLQRRVELNTDPVLTRPGLKHLAVHEGYPGHYVQFKIREVRYREGKGPADNLLSVVNTASSSPFEGIADTGMAMLSWIDEHDQVQMLLNRHRAGIGTAAAWQLHAEQRPEREVAAWLSEQALVGGDGWVRNRMRFIAAPARAVLIWSYWWGEPTVTRVYEKVPFHQRAEFFDYLYGRMHSLETVGMFSSAADFAPTG
ncbi:MAG: hypothetical protein KDD92_05950 [Caldilineaceae bacterium]|nr:hypothetical protein [Caldilineaceae bacterium]